MKDSELDVPKVLTTIQQGVRLARTILGRSDEALRCFPSPSTGTLLRLRSQADKPLVLFIGFAAIVLANIPYVATAILQDEEDPAFEGDKMIYRS